MWQSKYYESNRKIQGIGNPFGNIIDTFQDYSSLCEISYEYVHYFIGPLKISLEVSYSPPHFATSMGEHGLQEPFSSTAFKPLKLKCQPGTQPGKILQRTHILF